VNYRHNPITEWLARVAVECGSPLQMEIDARFIKNENTRLLVIRYAQLWSRRLGESKRA